ncbi:PREDICTED: protein C2-DOMAIN ABA-RELATED 8 isoform X2 [Camelina sativa]|uniref:Protein C2-DOMAIN ABA-RELATED 8 isoform X1 n=1 Tax=Camelina sativa TaxID=90675 RepID=A0ABM0WXK9_CAMSA|nr:PREDICTED: protein C2-DOMAIN ABA-RELATED 8 isoform X1 [Camelina sativa]XP_010477603.1 PREDICTED: protein C2-DOMAIN ABA-RELATED 8 isoform X2 [Camelina sativa]
MENLIGLLRIRLRRGINLVSRDSNTSDPFVVITMGSQKLKTRGVENSCNPEWNDELTLGINDPNQHVNLEVYDKDTFTSHDTMGDAEIDIKPFFEAQGTDVQDVSDGTEIRRVNPSGDNCLAEESRIIISNGKIVQDMILKLRNVESGAVDIQIEWINVPC